MNLLNFSKKAISLAALSVLSTVCVAQTSHTNTSAAIDNWSSSPGKLKVINKNIELPQNLTLEDKIENKIEDRDKKEVLPQEQSDESAMPFNKILRERAWRQQKNENRFEKDKKDNKNLLWQIVLKTSEGKIIQQHTFSTAEEIEDYPFMMMQVEGMEYKSNEKIKKLTKTQFLLSSTVSLANSHSRVSIISAVDGKFNLDQKLEAQEISTTPNAIGQSTKVIFTHLCNNTPNIVTLDKGQIELKCSEALAASESLPVNLRSNEDKLKSNPAQWDTIIN